MAQPLVSVLIPAHNASRWIGATLESVQAQTWPAVEVIVAEAGSTDGTRDVVRGYESSRVRLLPSAGRASAASNRNRAANAAQGEFLQFLDADDLLGPDKIRLQMERLAGDVESVASCEWARFHRDPSDAQFVPEPVWADLDSTRWLIRAWRGGHPMMQPGLWLIPRAVAERTGPWNEELTLIDDFEYGTRLLLAGTRVRFCAGARLYLPVRKHVEPREPALQSSLAVGLAIARSRHESPAGRRGIGRSPRGMRGPVSVPCLRCVPGRRGDGCLCGKPRARVGRIEREHVRRCLVPARTGCCRLEGGQAGQARVLPSGLRPRRAGEGSGVGVGRAMRP